MTFCLAECIIFSIFEAFFKELILKQVSMIDYSDIHNRQVSQSSQGSDNKVAFM